MVRDEQKGNGISYSVYANIGKKEKYKCDCKNCRFGGRFYQLKFLYLHENFKNDA